MNKKHQKSKLSIVTGGGGGIGSEIIQMLKDRGDTVYSIGRSDARSDHIQADLASDNGLGEIIPTLGRRKVDNLIFSHRYRGTDPREDCDISFLAIDRAINSLEQSLSRNASIVILSSVAAVSVFDEQSSIYHGTRSGLEGLTRFFAARLGAKGIRCNCVLPSTLIKSSNKKFFTKTNPVRRLIEEITPISRMGSAVDIANLVEFLCSSRASYITGQSIVVDGGLSLVNQESIARRLTDLQH